LNISVRTKGKSQLISLKFKFMDNNLDQAIKVIKNGGIVIFPTDTVWGIGCRLDNENSVKKLFEIRKRPKEKAVIVLVDSIAMAQE